jgi:hypothetical protein
MATVVLTLCRAIRCLPDEPQHLCSLLLCHLQITTSFGLEAGICNLDAPTVFKLRYPARQKRSQAFGPVLRHSSGKVLRSRLYC